MTGLISMLVSTLLFGVTESHPQQRVLTPTTSTSQPQLYPMAAEEVRKKLLEAEIIPTVIDDFTPSLALHAKWPSSHEQASLGNTLKPKDLQDAPTISLPDIHDTSPPSSESESQSATYIITLTDPDAPSRTNPTSSEFCHWIASGTQQQQSSPPPPPPPPPAAAAATPRGATHAAARALRNLSETMPYMPPTPPAGTGKHRYVFVAFVPGSSNNGAAADRELRLTKPAGRKHWGYETGGRGETKGVREWARENGLEPVGKPCGVTPGRGE
ncbi:hypothetical protein VTK26DRAFT_6203 [Humicola hyalothermophila]